MTPGAASSVPKLTRAPEGRSCAVKPGRSGRLRTLLNIMRDFHPASFLFLMQFLEGTTGVDKMADEMLTLLERKHLGFSRSSLEPLGADNKDACKMVGRYEWHASDVGLTASVSTIRKIKRLGKEAAPSDDELLLLFEELKGRLHDELAEQYFFALDAREAQFYGSPRDGWDEIIDRFPDAVSDIEEAAKCYALSRYAAAVFHSVHVVEFGLIELGAFIGVTDPLSGWTAVANRLQQIISTKHPIRTDFERDNFPFIEQMQGTVEALKNAWRNKVSHAQAKLVVLTADFSPEIAEEILYATRSFMRRLTDGLPAASPSP
jgi:hypothetical protein